MGAINVKHFLMRGAVGTGDFTPTKGLMAINALRGRIATLAS
jgi:hypothetical protein